MPVGYIRLSDLPLIPAAFAPTGLQQPSGFIFDQDRWGDAWDEGAWDGYGLEYEGMYPISHGRMSDGETPDYRGAGMGESILSTVGNLAIPYITISTTATGALIITQPFGSNQPTAPPSTGNSITDTILQFLQPSITVQTPAGPIQYAPYGPPTVDYSGYILAFTVFGAAASAVLTMWILKRAFEGKPIVPQD